MNDKNTTVQNLDLDDHWNQYFDSLDFLNGQF